jgi:hypothetical protein
MTLKKNTTALTEQNQLRLTLDLLEKALPIWEDYAVSNKTEYRDSVTGMHHVVRKDLLNRALEAVKEEFVNPESRRREIDQLKEEFSDPIVAMQDFDWELPYPVERVFYALWNLFDTVIGQNRRLFDNSQVHIAVNQVVDALVAAKVLSESEIHAVFKMYIAEK